MFFSLEYPITMEKIRPLTGISVAQLLFPTLVFADSLSSCPILLGFAAQIRSLIAMPLSLFQPRPNKKPSPQTTLLSREDIRTVMEKFELFCSQEGEEEEVGELSALFEEIEPSLEELKETFNVFDKNKDGFIDVEELQRVLLLIGLWDKGKLGIEECTQMIATFDHNKDGKIDFIEFVKLMEIALC
ncbi:probable calcium-binding protein CML45 [Momordica charantia]|uniref:Probable calcium-binding protein CML45 n=1 Tax=Momordica charantia TaxID=3673 RepID=A0A6J1E320_MOMCH|nr:probable calcium-binding protein CML45 [Momordica charantia]